MLLPIDDSFQSFNLLPSDLQVWNHHFFWESMQPEGGGLPEGGVLQQIEKDFGSFTNFREEFISSALQLLGSGWVWLLCKFPSIIFHVQAVLIKLADFLVCYF